MFVNGVKLMNEVEKLVPSIFQIRAQTDQPTDEIESSKRCISRLHGTLKSAPLFSEWELDFPSLVFFGNVRGDDIPVRVVNSRSQIMDDIPTYKGRLVYDSYVSFGPKITVSRYYICLDDNLERRAFLEKFRKLTDIV